MVSPVGLVASAGPMKVPLAPRLPAVHVQPQAAAVPISFSRGSFIVGAGNKAIKVPIDGSGNPTQNTSTPVGQYLFRKGDAVATWDARGLTVKKGKRTFSTRLAAVSLTPKLFSREEILANRFYFSQLMRSPDANAVSGARFVGSTAYFLLRWDDWSGATWLEALVKVNLGTSSPKPEFVGRFEGTSYATGGERLFGLFGRLILITQKPDGEWGRATYDPAANRFAYDALGQSIASFNQIGGLACALEVTPYGSKLLSRIDLRAPAKKTLMESRDSVRLLDERAPWLALAHEEGGIWLHNLDSGAKLRLPSDGGWKRTGMGLLMWSPKSKPSEAGLFDLERFEQIGLWTPEIQKQRELQERKKSSHTRSKKKGRGSKRKRKLR